MDAINLHTKDGRAYYRRIAAYLPDKSLGQNIAKTVTEEQ